MPSPSSASDRGAHLDAISSGIETVFSHHRSFLSVSANVGVRSSLSPIFRQIQLHPLLSACVEARSQLHWGGVFRECVAPDGSAVSDRLHTQLLFRCSEIFLIANENQRLPITVLGKHIEGFSSDLANVRRGKVKPLCFLTKLPTPQLIAPEVDVLNPSGPRLTFVGARSYSVIAQGTGNTPEPKAPASKRLNIVSVITLFALDPQQLRGSPVRSAVTLWWWLLLLPLSSGSFSGNASKYSPRQLRHTSTVPVLLQLHSAACRSKFSIALVRPAMVETFMPTSARNPAS